MKEIDCAKVFAAQLKKVRPKQSKGRPGFCADPGASSSVIGVKELNRIWAIAGKRASNMERSSGRFRFASASFNSLGRAQLPLQTPRHALPMQVALGVAPADMPALLGLGALDEHSLHRDAVANRLAKRAALEGKRHADG